LPCSTLCSSSASGPRRTASAPDQTTAPTSSSGHPGNYQVTQPPVQHSQNQSHQHQGKAKALQVSLLSTIVTRYCCHSRQVAGQVVVSQPTVHHPIYCVTANLLCHSQSTVSQPLIYRVVSNSVSRPIYCAGFPTIDVASWITETRAWQHTSLATETRAWQQNHQLGRQQLGWGSIAWLRLSSLSNTSLSNRHPVVFREGSQSGHHQRWQVKHTAMERAGSSLTHTVGSSLSPTT
jgi:hypothetical protein